jgi:tRNA (adenine37-N6)-methyltransferase
MKSVIILFINIIEYPGTQHKPGLKNSLRIVQGFTPRDPEKCRAGHLNHIPKGVRNPVFSYTVFRSFIPVAYFYPDSNPVFMNDDQGTGNTFTFTPIGTINTPFKDLAGMPIQPAGARGVRGTITIDETFLGGLLDLDGFSRIILIYALHRATGYSLEVIPFLDTKPHGIFATRAPKRPNPIGLSIVRLVSVNCNELVIEDVDILDGTPLLDLKPYVPAFDSFPGGRSGWFEGCCDRVDTVLSDRRFCDEDTNGPV